MSCTIVLVHGAFAESSSWDGVIDPLVAEGHRVVAAANPLRGLAADAKSVSDLVRSIEGPVVLVAHSYGGAVISNVDPDAGEIAGLVYVNGFAPDAGEHCFQLAAMYPGSMLGEETARPVSRSDGAPDPRGRRPARGRLRLPDASRCRAVGARSPRPDGAERVRPHRGRLLDVRPAGARPPLSRVHKRKARREDRRHRRKRAHRIE